MVDIDGIRTGDVHRGRLEFFPRVCNSPKRLCFHFFFWFRRFLEFGDVSQYTLVWRHMDGPYRLSIKVLLASQSLEHPT